MATRYAAGSLVYAPQGDSDGESLGVDHFVVDANGYEVCLAPNESAGRLMAAAPCLLAACEAAIEALADADMATEPLVLAVLRLAVEKAKGK